MKQRLSTQNSRALKSFSNGNTVIDKTLGHYKILKQIGVGGIGDVYLGVIHPK
jgi:hypothetical protein